MLALAFLSSGATKWNDQAKVVQPLKVCCYSAHCCYSGDSSAAIFTIPIIPRAARQYSFSYLFGQREPPALSPGKCQARPRIYFLISTPLWASAPCLAVIYLRPVPSLRLALILPLCSNLWKESDTQAINYLLRLSPGPEPKPPTSPRLWILSSSTEEWQGRLGWGGKKPYSTCFSCFVTSYNAFLPWVALWEAARLVRITYFIQLGKIRVGGFKKNQWRNGKWKRRRWKWIRYSKSKKIQYYSTRGTLSGLVTLLSGRSTLFGIQLFPRYSRAVEEVFPEH